MRISESQLRKKIRSLVSEQLQPLQVKLGPEDEFLQLDPKADLGRPISQAPSKYKSSMEIETAVNKLIRSLSKIPHPMSKTGQPVVAVMIFTSKDPRIQQKALQEFNRYAAKFGFTHPDDAKIKQEVWERLSGDWMGGGTLAANSIPWRQT